MIWFDLILFVVGYHSIRTEGHSLSPSAVVLNSQVIVS
jgi:hypothetical protein